MSSGLDSLRVVDPSVDPLILNTIAEEKLDFLSEVTDHEAALLKIFGRLRPGNPPQVDKARELFSERFYEENKYRLGKVGRFRGNRKFNEDVAESIMHIRPEDFLEIIKYMLKLRAQDESAYIDDIDQDNMKAWKVPGTPAYYLIQPDGIVAWSSAESTEEKVADAIFRLTSEA